MLHPDDCMQEIESLTVIAGNAIMKVREKGVARTDKADGSPVTEADLAADRIIIDGLAAIAPDIPAITEETYNAAADHEPQQYWCVDPLDGTKGFINGGAGFHRQYCPDHRPRPYPWRDLCSGTWRALGRIW